ncbi:hypothetical protein NHQ30_003974 [Ciborinia camelliae]|nr:hypothetical protein NHQ30_003974 [Ciborinia camelliae]
MAFRYRSSATSLISRSSLTLTTSRQRIWAASKPWPLAIPATRMHFNNSPTLPKSPFTNMLPGDWTCSSCGYHNFASKKTCRCGQDKSTVVAFNSEKLPAPSGPYSHVVRTHFAIFVSGQLPEDVNGNLVDGTMREKTAAVLDNLAGALLVANSSLDKIVKVQIFLTDMKDFAEMNKEYEKWITHKPARSCVAVKELPKGVNIEIECIALP